MKIQIIPGISQELFDQGREHEKFARENQEGLYEPTYGRWWVHRHWFFEHLHKTVIFEKAKELFGKDVKPSYSGMALYSEDWSICLPHYDRPQCKYSIDLCLKHDEPWALFVQGKKFILNENEALVYSGTDHRHWRERVKPGNKVTMAFFHFVDSDFSGPLD